MKTRALIAVAALALAGCAGDDAAPAQDAALATADRSLQGQRSGAGAGVEKNAQQPEADKRKDKQNVAAKGDGGAQSKEQRVARFRALADARLETQAPAVPVAVAEVVRGLMEAYHRGATNLTAAQEAVVVARTRGVVEAIFVEEGDMVREGQRLAQLETERLELEVARSRTQLENLEAAYQRAEQLHEAKMIPPSDYDTARFDYEAEQANLALREYELREAAIRATIDGVITRRHIKVGHTLDSSEPAFEMKRLSPVEAIVNVPEREIGRIRSGQYARVLADALPGARFEGEVSRVAPEVDPSSGTFRVTVALANEDGRLRPGMFGRVQVRVDQRPDTLLVPLEAVVTLRDKSSVFVVADGIVQRRSVTTGYASDGRIEILDGAVEGDQVVMTGQDGLRHGTPVRVVAGFSP